MTTYRRTAALAAALLTAGLVLASCVEDDTPTADPTPAPAAQLTEERKTWVTQRLDAELTPSGRFSRQAE